MPLAAPLFVVAMDHRAVMRRLFAHSGEDEAAIARRFADGKDLTFRGARQLLDRGVVAPASLAILVDERYGAAVAKAAPAAGCVLFMPVEFSRPTVATETPELEFEYGNDWAAHLGAFPIDGAKILVVHNPGMPEDRRARQAARCRLVMEWAHARALPFMLEVLVPPTTEQLAAVEGSEEQYRATLHPDLVAGAILDLRGRGVEPDIWKLEPLADVQDYRRIGALAREGHRSDVLCLLLGGGADYERVLGWVRDTSNVDGYAGFAIGRSLWQDPLTTYYEGRASAEDTEDAIASRLARLVSAYAHAA